MDLKTLAKQLNEIGQELSEKDPNFPFIALEGHFREKKFLELLRRPEYKELKAIFKRVVEENRIGWMVAVRKDFIKILKDKYGFSYSAIARLLKRDHSSIIHLYNK